MERERGQYFIQPFVGLAFISSDASLSYSSGYTGSPPVPVMHNVDIETQIGHVVGINLGRRWGNITSPKLILIEKVVAMVEFLKKMVAIMAEIPKRRGCSC